MRGDAREGTRHDVGIDDYTDDDLFLDAVDAIVLDALEHFGGDPEARLRFFRRLLAVAKEEPGGRRPS